MLETLLEFHTQEDRELFLSLAHCKGADMNKILGIISTNAIGLHLKGAKETYIAVCPVISRVNHGCGPNSYFGFDYKTFSMCLQATRDIPAFTEITVTYCPLYLSKSERIKELKIKYNFTCKCLDCKKFSAKSDQIRNDMRRWSEIYPPYHEWISDPERDASALLKSSLKGLVTLTKERVEGDPSTETWYLCMVLKRTRRI
ncbi:hypothetical protein K439DRAFT_1356488 [Ramaria rubella]|nr:hypothetical protein K439DRAFT_1356488 [Ramaria rubella]